MTTSPNFDEAYAKHQSDTLRIVDQALSQLPARESRHRLRRIEAREQVADREFAQCMERNICSDLREHAAEYLNEIITKASDDIGTMVRLSQQTGVPVTGEHSRKVILRAICHSYADHISDDGIDFWLQQVGGARVTDSEGGEE